MTTQFHEGQEVEVAVPGSGKVWKSDQTRRTWRKAKIVRATASSNYCEIRFTDGTLAMFNVGHIRAIEDYADTSLSPLNYDAPRGPGEQSP